MFAAASHPALSAASLVICVGSGLFMLWACVRLVSWASPLRWLAMWFALAVGSFIGFSAYGPLHTGVMVGPSDRLWEPSVFGLGVAIAIASAGTIGVWRSNREP